jgi:tRNA/tmRNA/rRNA uracil-C5-methylase (TrmA/RlmC/RlmD family)
MAFYVQSGAQSTLVLKTNRQPGLAWLDSTLRKDLEDTGIEGLWLNLHPCAGRRLFAKRGWHLLWGRPCSRDRHGLTYGPSAFQQLLPRLYAEALDEARAFLTPSGADLMVDLYCGIGSGLRRWSGAGSRTIGVECSREAVECARRNAPHALVLQGRCKDRLPQLEQSGNECSSRSGRRLLYVNPPRTGIEGEVLKWIVTSFRPKRMAYLSCSTGTLRRDLEELIHAGYLIKSITPYDFFPHTYHVETLVLLDEKGPGCGDELVALI